MGKDEIAQQGESWGNAHLGMLKELEAYRRGDILTRAAVWNSRMLPSEDREVTFRRYFAIPPEIDSAALDDFARAAVGLLAPH